MPKERQVSFAGGELAPGLYGRTDLDRYPVGARTIRNFIVSPHGVLVNRSGTQHIGALGTSVGRVISFVFSSDDSLMLSFDSPFTPVFGLAAWSIMSAYKQNALDPRHVFDKMSQTSVPYAPSDLANMRFAQLGNIVYVACEGHILRKFTRDPADDSFTVSDVSFNVPSLKQPVIDANAYYDQDQSGLAPGDSTHAAREWTWFISFVIREISTGAVRETSAAAITKMRSSGSVLAVPSIVAVHADWVAYLELGAQKGTDPWNAVDWQEHPSGAAPGQYEIEAIRIYRGRDGYVGLVGQTTGSSFIDDGAEPDFSNPPPAGENPFVVYSGGSIVRTERPRVVTFYEGRLYLASTTERPSTVWASSVGQFGNFDEVVTPDDSDSLEFTLASNIQETIRSLVPRQSMVALTDSSEWLIAGASEGGVITPNSIAARPISAHGSTGIEPEVSGTTIFFVKSKGISPRALVSGRESLESVDLSLLSKHLFSGFTVVDWAFASEPHSILWVVRSDGALLSLTYVPEQSMAAWARHDIDGGLCESVAVKPEGTEDSVWLVVNRDGHRHLERLAYREFTDLRHAIFLDSSSSYNGRQLVAGDGYDFVITDTLANDGVIGSDVTITFDASEPGGNKDGMMIQLDADDGGLPFLFLLSAGAGGAYTAQVHGRDMLAAMFGVNNLGTDWYETRASIGGLDHLNGQDITIVADTDVITGKTVSGGSVSVGFDAAVIHAGLPITAEFESLDATQDKTKEKIVSEVFVELERSRGGAVGAGLNETLEELPTREAEDDYEALALKREEHRVLITDRWKTSGKVALRQSEPMPMTVLGLTRVITHGG